MTNMTHPQQIRLAMDILKELTKQCPDVPIKLKVQDNHRIAVLKRARHVLNRSTQVCKFQFQTPNIAFKWDLFTRFVVRVFREQLKLSSRLYIPDVSDTTTYESDDDEDDEDSSMPIMVRAGRLVDQMLDRFWTPEQRTEIWRRFRVERNIRVAQAAQTRRKSFCD